MHMRAIRYSVLIVATTLGAASASFGQGPPRTDYGVAAGLSVRAAEQRALGGDVATHVNLDLTHWWGAQRRFGSRGVAGLDFFMSQAAAIPSCAPGGVCQTERSLALIASIDLEGVARSNASGRLRFTAGSGLYIASTAFFDGGGEGKRTLRALGLGAGAEAMIIPNLVGLGVRFRYFPSGLGEIRGLTTGVLSLRI